MVRCKFKCVEKAVQQDGTAVIKMVPVTCGSSENEKFFAFTPWGEFTFGTVNAEAAKEINEGKEYYIDISADGKPCLLTLKQSFEQACSERFGDPKCLCVAVQLPTGAVELITNTEKIGEKCEYYKNAYDECFCLKTNPQVKIVDFMLV